MAKLFDAKIFNEEVFANYIDRLPNLNRNELLRSRAIVGDPRLVGLFGPQTGSYEGTLPLMGNLDGTPVNYDGQTDITSTSIDTYAQHFIVIGRAKGWTEKDFSYDITGGEDFFSGAARQVMEYWEHIYQGHLLTVLNAIFSMTGTDNLKFVNGHTYNISNAATDNKVSAVALNKGIQKACGDNKQKFSLVVMHSVVATDLENLNLLNFLKYTDKFGIQRDLALGTWNGKLVLVDDEMPEQEGYFDATSTTEGALKVVASSATTGQINLDDVTPYYGDKTLAANDYVVKDTRYITYALGEGAIIFQDVGAEVPYEMSRDAKTIGGQDTLYSRKRYVIAPKGISWKGTPTSLSPTDVELGTGTNWELVDNKKTSTNKKVFPHKAIVIARVITR